MYLKGVFTLQIVDQVSKARVLKLHESHCSVAQLSISKLRNT